MLRDGDESPEGAAAAVIEYAWQLIRGGHQDRYRRGLSLPGRVCPAALELLCEQLFVMFADGLLLLFEMADREDERFQSAAARWHAYFVLEAGLPLREAEAVMTLLCTGCAAPTGTSSAVGCCSRSSEPDLRRGRSASVRSVEARRACGRVPEYREPCMGLADPRESCNGDEFDPTSSSKHNRASPVTAGGMRPARRWPPLQRGPYLCTPGRS